MAHLQSLKSEKGRGGEEAPRPDLLAYVLDGIGSDSARSAFVVITGLDPVIHNQGTYRDCRIKSGNDV